MTLILGVDDAGRGPIIGPMILAGVLMTKEQEAFLKKEGATDSKLLFHRKRIKLAKLIKQNSLAHKVLIVQPEEIDDYVSNGKNLNTLEAKKCAEVIKAINDKSKKIEVILDCPSINMLSWKNKLFEFLGHPGNLLVKCEHKADFNHASVAAASILAKVAREDEMTKIRKKYEKYGNLGSGYPSDPSTKEFLKSQGHELENSGIFRKSWSTWKKLYGEKANTQNQKKLFEF